MSSHSSPGDVLDDWALDASQLPTGALKVDLMKRLDEIDYVEHEASEKENADDGSSSSTQSESPPEQESIQTVVSGTSGGEMDTGMNLAIGDGSELVNERLMDRGIAVEVDLVKETDTLPVIVEDPLEEKEVGQPRKVSSGDNGGRSPEMDDALKNTDDGDLDPPEKPSLGRSSGDDTIEEDSLDSKQKESNCVEPAAIIDDVRKSGISVVKGEGFVSVGDVKPLDTGAHKNTLPSAKRKFDREAVGNNYAPKGKRLRSAEGGPKISEPQSGAAVVSTMPNDSSGTDFVRIDGYNYLVPVDRKASMNKCAPKGKRRLSAVEGSKSFEPQSGAVVGSMRPNNSSRSVFGRLSGFNSLERMVPPPSKRPTNSLRIDHFLRPFTIVAVKKLLGKTGTLTSFWMDSIKTHCYVSYSSVEEAVATHNAVNNLQWPPDVGHSLVAIFVDPEEVKIRAEGSPVSPSGDAIPTSSTQHHANVRPGTTVQEQASRHHLPPPPPPPPPYSPTERVNVSPPSSRQARLEDFFLKTRASPSIFYLPLTDEQVDEKKNRDVDD